MKKWLNQKRLIVILSVILMFSATGNVLAASQLTKITAYLNAGITMLLNGEKFEAIDETTGKKLLPITYQGRTYLPLRSIADASGMDVNWNGAKQTISLGEETASEEIISGNELLYTPVTPEYVDANDAGTYRLKSKEPKILNRGPKSDFEYGYANDSIHAYYLRVSVDNSENFDVFKTRIWLEDSAESALQKGPFIEVYGFGGVGSILVMDGEDVQFGQYYDVEVDIKNVKDFYIRVNGVLSVIGEPMLERNPN